MQHEETAWNVRELQHYFGRKSVSEDVVPFILLGGKPCPIGRIAAEEDAVSHRY